MKLTLLGILLYLVYAQVTYVTTAEVIEDGDYAEQGIRVKRQISHSKARSYIKKYLPRYVRKIRIPDYSRKRSLYSVSLTGGKVTSYTLPRIKFSKSGKYTIAKAQGGRISAQAKYKLRFTILKSSGTVKVTVKNVNLILKAYFDRKLHIKSCSSSVGSVSVKISSKFLNLFRKYLEKPLKKNLTRMLCSWTKKFP